MKTTSLSHLKGLIKSSPIQSFSLRDPDINFTHRTNIVEDEDRLFLCSSMLCEGGYVLTAVDLFTDVIDDDGNPMSRYDANVELRRFIREHTDLERFEPIGD